MTPEEYLALLQSQTQRKSDPESVLQWYQSYNDQLRAKQSQIEQQRLEKERIAAERFAAQESAMLKAQQEQAVRKARTDDASDQYNPRVFFNSEGFKNASYKKKRELAEEWVNTVGTKYAEPAALEDFRKNLDERLGIAEPKSTIAEDAFGVWSGAAVGLVGGIKAVTDLAGVDNAASEYLSEEQKKLRGLYSAEQVERSKQLDEQGQKYEADGNVLGQVMTGAERILTTGPGAAEMIGSTAAALIPGAAVGKLSQGAALAKGASAAVAAARATKAATTAMGVTGAAIGAGSVKGGIYEAVQNASDTELMGDQSYALMRKNGLTEKQAKEQFGKEQSEYMNSPLAIIAGAAAGFAAARLGSVERAVAGAGKAESQKAIAEAAKQLSTKNTKFAVSPALINRSGEFLRGAGREVLTEVPQAATEVLAANLGASPAIPATRGLAESVGAAIAGGTALGGPAGLVQSRVDQLTQAKQTAPTEQPPEQQPEVPQAGEVENARRVVEEYQATQNPELSDEYESALTILENAGVIVGEAQATETTVTPEVKSEFNVLDSYAIGEIPTDADWNSALQTIAKAGLDPDAYLEDRTVRRLPAAAANAATNVAISTSGGVPVGGTITAPVGDRAGQRSGQQDAGTERNITGAAPVGTSRIGPLNDEQIQSTSVDGKPAENLGVEGQVEQINVEEPINVESLVGQVVDYGGNVGILAKTQSGYYVNGQVVESGMSGQPAQTLGIKQLPPERAEAFIAGEQLGRIAPELQQVPRETDLDVDRDVLLLENELVTDEDIEIAELESQLAEIDAAANEIRSSKTLNLFSMLKGSLSRSEQLDVSPDRIYRLLRAKEGGADLSDMVSDGALNDFLPYEMRPDSSRFDAADSTEYIKEKLRARDFVPYDVEIELSRLGYARQQIESEINEIKSIRQANEELQQLAEDEAIARSESGIADAAGVQAGVLTSPTETEVVAQQERVAQAEQLDQRDQIRKESEATPFSLTVQEGRVDNTGTLWSETSDPIQNPTTPNAIKQAVNALFGGDVWAKISRGTEIVETVADIPAESVKVSESGQAFYNSKTKKIYMISDRIKAGTEAAVWLHEVFHKQGSNLLDEAQMKRLQSTVESWKSKPQGSTERQIYDAANERATKSGNYDDEFLAYTVEESVNLGVTPDATKPITTADGWLGKVQAWFSKALSKLTGKSKAVDFTPQDLVAMAYGAAGLELEGIEGAGPTAFGGKDIVLSLNQPEARENIEGAIREREPKVLRPRATRIGESIGTQLTDYKIKGRNLIDEAGQKYGGMLEKAGERLQNAMTTARNQGNGLVEIMTRDIVAPLEEEIKAISKANGIKPNNGRIYGGELAAARHALDLSKKKQDRLFDDLLTAEINEEISKDLADVAKAEKANIAEVVERIRGMEDRFKKAWDEGRDFALSRTTVTRQVNELAQIVERMVATIAPLQKGGIDRTLTAGKVKKVNDAMLRLAADSVRSGDPYLMLEVARKYTEAVSSMADLPKAKEVHKKAKEELAKWKKAQSTPLRLDKAKQDIATETPVPGGMTMAEAQAIIDMRESQPGVGEIADLLVKAFRDINTQAVNNKIITAEKKAELEAQFPYYVSMSGDKNADADDDFMFSRGRNFIDKAEGRTGFMGQQNAFDNVIAKVQQLGNKVAAQAVARPAYDYMVLESQTVPENERLFEKVKMPGQNVMKVYSMGTTQYFQGKPQVMKDAIGDLVDADNFLIKAGQAATRGYGSWMTKYVTLFAPVSSFKELLTRTVNLVQLRNYKKADGTKYTIGDVYKIRGSTLKNALSPTNFWDAAKYATTGETSPDLEKLLLDGGKMSFSDMLTTEGEVSNAFKKKYPGAWKTVGFIPKVFHIWNQMFEVSVLLASYKGLMANGMSSKDAAAFVVSQMNFGAKGKATNFLRTFFPFVNPTMQDALQVKRSLYDKGRVNYQGVVELTVLIALLGVMYEMARDSEEDEFGKPKVDAMPMSMVANGFSIGNLYIPMPFGIPQLANVMSIAMSRLANGVYTKGEAAAEIAASWAKAFTPQGVSEIEAKKDMLGFLMSTAAPALAKPAYHASKGINAFGTKVAAAERSDVYKSEQGMRMTPEAYKKFAKAVNDNLGVDANPEQYKILAEGYLLGPMRAVLDTITDPIADRESKGGDTTGMRTPINYALGINRLYKEFPESQIIETRFGDAYVEYQKLAKQFNADVKKVLATESRNQKLNRFYEAGATDAQVEFIDAVLDYESETRKENAEMKKIYENGILSDDPTMQELGRDTLKDMYAQKLERKREIARMHLQLKDQK